MVGMGMGIGYGSLFYDGAGENLSIWAGTLDGPTGLRIAGHIFCKDKGDYYDIPEGVPQVAGYDPALTTMVPDGATGPGKG